MPTVDWQFNVRLWETASILGISFETFADGVSIEMPLLCCASGELIGGNAPRALGVC